MWPLFNTIWITLIFEAFFVHFIPLYLRNCACLSWKFFFRFDFVSLDGLTCFAIFFWRRYFCDENSFSFARLFLRFFSNIAGIIQSWKRFILFHGHQVLIQSACFVNIRPLVLFQHWKELVRPVFNVGWLASTSEAFCLFYAVPCRLRNRAYAQYTECFFWIPLWSLSYSPVYASIQRTNHLVFGWTVLSCAVTDHEDATDRLLTLGQRCFGRQDVLYLTSYMQWPYCSKKASSTFSFPKKI